MSFLVNFFYSLFYRPFLNLFLLLYQFLPVKDFGLTIVIFTLFVRTFFISLESKNFRAQKQLALIEEEIEKARERFKDDRERLNQELLEIYKRAGVSPFASFFLVIVQIPFLVALYQIFSRGLFSLDSSQLYSFVILPEINKPTFLGFFDLSRPNIFLAFITAIFQFLQIKAGSLLKKQKKIKKHPLAKMISFQTAYLFPFFIFFVLIRLPSALAIYLLISSIFSIIQAFIWWKTKK